jgi:hypothetical protein
LLFALWFREVYTPGIYAQSLNPKDNRFLDVIERRKAAVVFSSNDLGGFGCCDMLGLS